MSATGAQIMSVFATIWWVAGIRTSGRGSALLYSISLIITAAIFVAASRRPARAESAGDDARTGRLVGIASGVEGLLILVAVNVLANIKKLDFFAPVVAIIVGVHFLPLARWLPAPSYYATGAVLIALGIAGFNVQDPSQRLLAVSIGAAVVLWLTCAVVLRFGDDRR